MSPRGTAVALMVLPVLMLAGIVHIASVLALPFVAPDDAYARLSGFSPEGVVRVLPRAGTPGDPLPGRDPSLATAICRYDLDQGPLRVSATLGDGIFVALALHARSGVAYYALNDRAGNDGKLDMLVMTPDQVEAATSRDPSAGPVRDVRVVAPERRGFVSFDVLPRTAGYAQAVRDLASMGCSVEHPL